MRYLITGITGFVGSHLAEYLLKKNVDIFGICRWRSPRENISEIENRINLLECDLRDLPSVIKTLGEVKPDYIFHLAAQSFVPVSFREPVETMNVNVIGTINLFEALRFLKLDPIIHVCSTSDVYGETKKGESPISEKNQMNPTSPYAVSKAAQELAARQYFLSHGTKIIVSRAFNHTGPRRGAVFAESSFARQIAEIEKGMKLPEIEVGNLEPTRTFADVRDIVRAYYMLVKKGRVGEVYNIAGDSTTSIKKILEVLISLSNSKIIKVKVNKNLLRPSDPISKIPNDKKFRKISGWKPEIPIEKTLEDLLNFWRSAI